MKRMIKVLLALNVLSIGVFGIQQVTNQTKGVQAVDENVPDGPNPELPYEN